MNVHLLSDDAFTDLQTRHGFSEHVVVEDESNEILRFFLQLRLSYVW